MAGGEGIGETEREMWEWIRVVETAVKWKQMAEVLNEYFSSVFTTEDISSLPVPLTKFEGNKSEHLGQLFVTPEMIAKKIKKMKDNKSPGVDGIPPKLLKEIVDQISTPLANLFNLSLEEGIVPSEWKK